MEVVEQLWWLLYVSGFVMDAVGQVCTEFPSPMLIETSSAEAGTIRVPRTGSKYKNNQLCQWTIATDAGYCIQLDVTACTLEGKDIHGDCSNDYVDVFDSTDDRDIFIGRFCGKDQGKSFKTASSKMIVRFMSNQVFEYSGFEALYQSVVPDDSADETNNTKILGMAVGISVGVFALLTMLLTILLIVRYRKKKAASRTNPPAVASNQNDYPNMGLPGGNPSSEPTHYVDRCGIYINVDQVRDLDPHLSNELLQAVTPCSFHDDPRNLRSVTPPPSYDSLDYVNTGYNRMSLSPPPYDMVVKYSIESSSV